MNTPVVVDAIRSPMARAKPDGALAQLHPVDLLSQVLEQLVQRNRIDPGAVDDVLTGCVSQAGEQAGTPGRLAWLAAGLPAHVPSTTIDRKCGSSQQAVHFAVQAIMSGTQDMVIACGVESMSRVPMGSSRMGQNTTGARFDARFAPGLVGQGVSADLVAARWGLGREELDAYAARSHQRAHAAQSAGHFEREIVGITTPAGLFTADETIRPATTAQKLGALKAVFDDVKTDPARPAITAMAGAASANAIAQTATATITAGDEAAIAAIAARLQAAKGDFTTSYAGQGGPFTIDIQHSGATATVKVTGTSAHGSRPEEGVNPVPRLTLFLQQVLMPTDGVALVQPNAYSNALRYINGAFGLDYFGKQLGVAYADDFMGPLTLSPNLIKAADGKLEVTTNVRMPRGKTPEQLRTEVEQRITRWSEAAKVPLTLQYTQGNWMARDPKGAWLSTLLNIFGDTTGLDAKPVPTAGSTTAKLMPNAINFGPAMPGKKYTAHNALEYKELPDLRADMQMFTEMLVRIGNLKQMQ